jgi:hypothetical protein
MEYIMALTIDCEYQNHSVLYALSPLDIYRWVISQHALVFHLGLSLYYSYHKSLSKTSTIPIVNYHSNIHAVFWGKNTPKQPNHPSPLAFNIHKATDQPESHESSEHEAHEDVREVVAVVPDPGQTGDEGESEGDTLQHELEHDAEGGGDAVMAHILQHTASGYSFKYSVTLGAWGKHQPTSSP